MIVYTSGLRTPTAFTLYTESRIRNRFPILEPVYRIWFTTNTGTRGKKGGLSRETHFRLGAPLPAVVGGIFGETSAVEMRNIEI